MAIAEPGTAVRLNMPLVIDAKTDSGSWWLAEAFKGALIEFTVAKMPHVLPGKVASRAGRAAFWQAMA